MKKNHQRKENIMDNVRDYRLKKVTPKNERIFKEQVAIMFEKGIVSGDFYKMVQLKNYCKSIAK